MFSLFISMVLSKLTEKHTKQKSYCLNTDKIPLVTDFPLALKCSQLEN